MCNDHKVVPLHIMLQQAGAYVKSYDRELHGCIF